MTKKDDIARLNAAFGAEDSVMTGAEYNAKRLAIMGRDDEPEPASHNVPVIQMRPRSNHRQSKEDLLQDKRPMTRGFFARALQMISGQTGQVITKAINDKVAPILSRLAMQETRLSAAIMLLPGARGKSGEDVSVSQFIELIERMQARIDALEASSPSAMAYSGVWQSSSRESKANTFYTDKGAIWFCRRPTMTRPGESDDWKLAAKSR